MASGAPDLVLDALRELRGEVHGLRDDLSDLRTDLGQRVAVLEAAKPGDRLTALEARHQRTLGRDATVAAVGAALATLAGLVLTWATR